MNHQVVLLLTGCVQPYLVGYNRRNHAIRFSFMVCERLDDNVYSKSNSLPLYKKAKKLGSRHSCHTILGWS